MHSQPSFCSAGLSFVLFSFGYSLFGSLFGLGSLIRQTLTEMATSTMAV